MERGKGLWDHPITLRYLGYFVIGWCIGRVLAEVLT